MASKVDQSTTSETAVSSPAQEESAPAERDTPAIPIEFICQFEASNAEALGVPKVLNCLGRIWNGKANHFCPQCYARTGRPWISRFFDLNAYVRHCLEQHPELPKPLGCGKCGVNFADAESYEQHLFRRPLAGYLCRRCNLVFARKVAVLEHVYDVHGDAYPHNKPPRKLNWGSYFCSSKLDHLQATGWTSRHADSGGKSLLCRSKQLASSSSGSGAAGPAKLVCPECKKVFSHRVTLHKHRMGKHTDLTFKCPECNAAKFRSKWRLLEHIRTTHKDSPMAAKRDASKDELDEAQTEVPSELTPFKPISPERLSGQELDEEEAKPVLTDLLAKEEASMSDVIDTEPGSCMIEGELIAFKPTLPLSLRSSKELVEDDSKSVEIDLPKEVTAALDSVETVTGCSIVVEFQDLKDEKPDDLFDNNTSHSAVA